jgi:hypothetical protein
MIMNLKTTFLAFVSTLLMASCGTSSVDSKKCVSYTRDYASYNTVYTFNYSDSKLIGFKSIRTSNSSGDIDSTLYQAQYDNNLIQSTNEEELYSDGSILLINSVFEYNSEGRVISQVRNQTIDGNPFSTYNCNYVWSNNDLTVDMLVEYTDSTGYQPRKTYHFNSFGQKVEVIQHNYVPPASSQLFYDDKNSPFKNIIFPLRIAWSDYFPPFSDKINNINGAYSRQYNYTYDNDDFPTSLDIINEDGTTNSTHTWTYD